ncbi:MAG: branched-chain amino acid transport system substrate-binding protein [Micromonosporaceae bacterium]
MRRINGRVLRAVSAIVAIALLPACGSSFNTGTITSDSVKIGLLIPQSGVYAPLGTDISRGFHLYLDAHGGQLGHRRVALVTADEGAGPDSGVPAGQKLIQQSQVAVAVGVVNSATALGLIQPYNEAKVPLIIANAGANALTGAKRSAYVWRTSFANGDVGASMGAYVASRVDFGQVYLIAPDYAAGHEQIGGFREAFEAAGGKVAGADYPPFGTTSNYQPYLARIQRSGARAVFCFFSGAEAVSFVKQYTEFGLAPTIPLYATGYLTEGSVLRGEGAAALGIQTGLHYSTELDTATNHAFVAAYVARYHAPPTVFSVAAYDAAQVLDRAMAGARTGAQIVAGLGRLGDIDSPRGTWHFSDTHNPVQRYYLREVRDQGGGLVNAILRTLSS